MNCKQANPRTTILRLVQICPKCFSLYGGCLFFFSFKETTLFQFCECVNTLIIVPSVHF